jgi:DNA-binding NtrC family response regulator
VLQEGRFERVGGEETLEVDVRVVAATHRALEEMVDEGTFRPDLYYRLSVFPVRIPPLRERLDDIRPLVARLMPKTAQRLGRSEPRLAPAAWRWLLQHPWPGNVRELENRIERALILARDDQIEVADLTESRRGVVAGQAASLGEGLPPPLQSVVREAIGAALRYTEGRIYGVGGAAEVLELNPSTLQSKMKKLGIRRTDFVP